MDYSDMTPEELRGLAASMEAKGMFEAHTGGEVPPTGRKDAVPPRFARVVEVEGTAYTVDMRRFKSREFVKMLARIQDEGDAAGVSEQMEAFDYALEPCSAAIEAAVENELGYVDFERYYEIASAIFEAVNAKN